MHPQRIVRPQVLQVPVPVHDIVLIQSILRRQVRRPKVTELIHCRRKKKVMDCKYMIFQLAKYAFTQSSESMLCLIGDSTHVVLVRTMKMSLCRLSEVTNLSSIVCRGADARNKEKCINLSIHKYKFQCHCRI